ncbi:hypothetical protein [Mycolicibacterium goodii]|uniref:hypothetical protein n=1 Tax=Mycolicibacterium goodii TaxID=134601 RepID=UPI000C258B97|nr:hypothetical protein [Mycolicibacterium goodii]PJK18855.1 hypothetical protein CSX11_29110 [Mycolicibacterium goodii]
MKTADTPRKDQKEQTTVSDALPPELLNRCAAIQECDSQGEPLTRRDYLLFAVVTLALPTLLVLIGAML